MKFTKQEIALLIEAVNTWESRYRCHFCTHLEYEEKATSLRQKLFALRDGREVSINDEEDTAVFELPPVLPNAEAAEEHETKLESFSSELLEAMFQDAVKKEKYEIAGKIKSIVAQRKTA